MRQAYAEYAVELAAARPQLNPASPKPAPAAACPICGGLGWYTLNVADLDDPRFGKAYSCDCRAVDRSRQLQRVDRLTDSERAVTLDDITPTGGDTDAMLAAARDLIAQPDHILTLWGASGNAKSLALQGIVNECVRRGLDAIYIEMKTLADYIRKLHASDSGVYDQIERFKTVRVLAIDEFDKLKVTDWYYEFETDVMSRRYRDALDWKTATVFAMNKDPRLYLPDHIYSRIFDGRNVVVCNNDSDQRPLMLDGG